MTTKVYRLLVVMNLYPLTARKPGNLLDVADRVHELSYGNRLRQDRAGRQADQQAGRARSIDLAKARRSRKRSAQPGAANAALGDARQFKIAKIVDIDLQSAPGGRGSRRERRRRPA